MRLLSSLVFAAALVLPGLAQAQSHWIAPGKIDTFPLCMRPRGQFLAMLAHELGHAVGFRHVDPQRYPTSIMKPSLGADFIYPSGKEQFHGDLAYDIGRGKGYCGWPHGDNCPRRGGLSLDPPWMGPPPIAID